MAGAIDVELLESLVRKHFGAEWTCRLAWDVLRNRYVASEEPRRLARPQRLLGFRIGWKTAGEFSYNLGFRLEVWSPGEVAAALALAAEYNSNAGTRPPLSVHAYSMPWPASSQPVPA